MSVLVFGELLIDCFPDDEVVAGAPLHVAAHLASLGIPDVALVSRIGMDRDGERVLQTLERFGIDRQHIQRDKNLPTGRVTIHGDSEAGSHSFEIHRPAAWDAIEDSPSLQACFDPKLFVFGSLASRAKTSRDTLFACLERLNAFKVFDLNLRPPDVDFEVIQKLIASCHLLKCNEEEWKVLSQEYGFASPAVAAGRYPKLSWICITRGAQGAELWGYPSEDQKHKDDFCMLASVEAPSVQVIDTVGAGDAFTAGLAYEWLQATSSGNKSISPQRMLSRGRSLSARVLVRRGGLLTPNVNGPDPKDQTPPESIHP